MNCIYLKTKDHSLKDVLVDAVKQAKKRFWCVTPFVTADGLNLIIDEMKPRIDYRLITRLDTGDMFFGSLDLDIIIKFIQNNGKVRFHNECLHSKLWISDDKVFIGSANLTGHALEKNNELMVMAHNEKFSEECRPIEWFEILWNKLAGSEKTIKELKEISQEAQSKKNIFEKINRQMPKSKDYGKSPVVTIEELHRKFWKQLLKRAKDKGVTLHADVSPSDDHWLQTGAGKSGLHFSYVILRTHHKARVELVIEISDKKLNKAIFDKLEIKKKQIESEFGDVLNWERLPDEIRCKINYTINKGGLDDQNKWIEIQDAMIDAMDRLSRVLKPHIQALDK